MASTAIASRLKRLEIARSGVKAARRKAIKTPSRVYTDADLRRLPLPGPVTATAPQVTVPAAAGEQTRDLAQPAATVVKAPAEQEPERDEAWWRTRMTEARAKLDQSKFLCDAIQSRINALTNDWSAADDPIHRAALAADRDKALGELERLQKDVTTQTKAVADIEEEARLAGVPPGWLR